MTASVTSLPTRNVRALPDPAEVRRAAFRDYSLAMLDNAPSLKHAVMHAKEARDYGADPGEIVRLLETWCREHGMSWTADADAVRVALHDYIGTARLRKQADVAIAEVCA
jgi:hypothetical protein